MSGSIPLFMVNPDLDRQDLARRFAHEGRVQVRNVLTPDTAATIAGILAHDTPWGIAWMHENQDRPKTLRERDLQGLAGKHGADIQQAVANSAGAGKYAYIFAQYPMLTAYLDKWQPDSPHDLLLEYLNDEPFLGLVRDITGIAELVKADAQATLFAPSHFLTTHDDSHVAEGWRIAYVLNFAIDWRPDWGGYLLFYDEDEDVVEGFKPRFNALNLFAVPQRHSVSYVPPFAPAGRLAITGWLRDR